MLSEAQIGECVRKRISVEARLGADTAREAIKTGTLAKWEKMPLACIELLGSEWAKAFAEVVHHYRRFAEEE